MSLTRFPRSLPFRVAALALTLLPVWGCSEAPTADALAPAGGETATPAATTPSPYPTPADGFAFPAEWEPHQAVWVAWVAAREGGGSAGDGGANQGGSNSGGSNSSATTPPPTSSRVDIMNDMTVEIIGALRDRVHLQVIVQSEQAAAAVEARLRAEDVWTDDLTFRIHETPYFWMRDPGPLFLRNAAGELAVADFAWNRYGALVDVPADNPRWERERINGNLDRHYAEQLGLPVVATDMVSEGGGMTVNGRGTMMATKQTALQRNPGHTLDEIEAEYLRVMGQKKMVWLERSIVEDLYLDGPIAANYTGCGANGHLDEYARFVGPSTVLLAEVPEEERFDNPVNELNYDVLEENYRVLAAATDQDGNPFEVIRIPMPEVDPLVREYALSEGAFNREPGFAKAGLEPGDTMRAVAAASYLNYLVTNEVVLVAEYWEEGMPASQKDKDEAALRIFREIWPEREVIALRPIGINRYGGGVHCATQQMPEKLGAGGAR